MYGILLFLAVYAAREQKIRDDWVKAMEARIIREQLSKCYKTEGVNHCKRTRPYNFWIERTVKTNNVRKC